MKEYEKKQLTASRADALLALIDDPSPAVQAGLRREIATYGEEAWSLLKQAQNSPCQSLRSAAAELFQELGLVSPEAAFKRFIHSFQYELETGCLLLERTHNPQLRGDAYTVKLDEIATRIRELTALPSSMKERCRVLNRVFFHEYGFRGNSEDFYNPQNSFLSQVLETRKGIPITLCIIYLLVAERVGLELEPVGLPQRFMVGCFRERTPFYIDAYERGIARSPEQLAHFLNGLGVEPHLQHMMPTSVGEILCRCCRNLHRQFASIGREKEAGLYAEFVDEFQKTYEQHAQSE